MGFGIQDGLIKISMKISYWLAFHCSTRKERRDAIRAARKKKREGRRAERKARKGTVIKQKSVRIKKSDD